VFIRGLKNPRHPRNPRLKIGQNHQKTGVKNQKLVRLRRDSFKKIKKNEKFSKSLLKLVPAITYIKNSFKNKGLTSNFRISDFVLRISKNKDLWQASFEHFFNVNKGLTAIPNFGFRTSYFGFFL